MEQFEPIPVPPLEDEIGVYGQGHVSINRDNTEVHRHKYFEEMNHLRIKDFGTRGLLIFGIDATPTGDYLAERGYTIVNKEYPDVFTQRTWLSFVLTQMEIELEEGKGHEVDEGDV